MTLSSASVVAKIGCISSLGSRGIFVRTQKVPEQLFHADDGAFRDLFPY